MTIGRAILWILLGLPATGMLFGYSQGKLDAGGALHPTGEMSARLMILTMMIGPLADLLGQRGWLRWLLRHRRHIGVAAFIYAALHTLFYLIDKGWSGSTIFRELAKAGIWTGWVALGLMLLPALASNDAAMRMLRRNWKRVQQLAYGAAIFTVLHWLWVINDHPITPIIVHFAPLVLLNAARLAKRGKDFGSSQRHAM